MTTASARPRVLRPYVPELLLSWTPTHGDDRHMRVEGSMAFVDISGFTKLTERLARRGKVGAEEMSDLLDATFSALLRDARSEGGDLVKWGGDSVLLFFREADHAARCCRAVHDMRSTLRSVETLRSTSASVTLRMSAGVHSGAFDFYVVGDPSLHRELLVVGPESSTTAVMRVGCHGGADRVEQPHGGTAARHRTSTDGGGRQPLVADPSTSGAASNPSTDHAPSRRAPETPSAGSIETVRRGARQIPADGSARPHPRRTRRSGASRRRGCLRAVQRYGRLGRS